MKHLFSPTGLYFFAWFVGIVIIIAGETAIIPTGSITNESMRYMLSLFAIICTLGGAYVALKFFHFSYVRRRLMKKCNQLRTLHFIRVTLLAAISWGDLVIYYATLSSQGGFCAIIAALAFVFCYPSKLSPNTPKSREI